MTISSQSSALELPTLELVDEPDAASPQTATALSLSDVDFVNDAIGVVPRCPHVLRHPIKATFWLIRVTFGVVVLIALLALLAAVPIVNLFVLGYLLETEARVARSGRLRDAFPLLELAPRLGTLAIGVFLWLIPLMVLSSFAADAKLIDPSSQATRTLNGLVPIAAGVVFVHLLLAVARGGTAGCFVRPLKNLLWLRRQFFPRAVVAGGKPVVTESYLLTAERHVQHFLSGLRIPHYFSLGLRGLIGGLLWLTLPTALFAVSNSTRGATILVTILGGLLLVVVFGWMPFLQTHFAVENRLGAWKQLSAARQRTRRAPFAALLAILTTYVLALPLYLSKIVLTPGDAVFLLTPLFIVSIYPAKVVTGWAYARASKRETDAWFGWRWLCRGASVAVLLAYVFILYFTQFIGAQGKSVLFQHHAFLLPVPF